jgi:hypothetical protein
MCQCIERFPISSGLVSAGLSARNTIGFAPGGRDTRQPEASDCGFLVPQVRESLFM